MIHHVDMGETSNVVLLRPKHPLPLIHETGSDEPDPIPCNAGGSLYDDWGAQDPGRDLISASQDCIEMVDDLGHLRLRNPLARRMLGHGTLAGLDHRCWAMTWPTEVRDVVSDAQAVAVAVGRARFAAWRPTCHGESLYWDVVLSRVVDADGRIVGLLAVSRDMTELRRVEDGHDLRGRELGHRLKNIFALVTGLVTLSARNLPEVQPYAQGLRERFTAMSRALDYLHLAPPDEAAPCPRQTLQGLLRALLGPYDDAGDMERRFHFRAVDDVPVGDGSVTGLALVIHELATNAVKYGALSEEGGTVTVDCRRNGGELCLDWTERGGPRIGLAPCHEGFGSQLTARTVRGQLGGTITHHWDPQGLTVVLTLPTANLTS